MIGILSGVICVMQIGNRLFLMPLGEQILSHETISWWPRVTYMRPYNMTSLVQIMDCLFSATPLSESTLASWLLKLWEQISLKSDSYIYNILIQKINLEMYFYKILAIKSRQQCVKLNQMLNSCYCK